MGRKTKIATSGTAQGILKLIKEYFMSENILIDENLSVINTKLNRQVGEVRTAKGRYVFYR